MGEKRRNEGEREKWRVRENRRRRNTNRHTRRKCTNFSQEGEERGNKDKFNRLDDFNPAICYKMLTILKINYETGK